MDSYDRRERSGARRAQRRIVRAAGAVFVSIGVIYMVLRSDYDEIREEG